MSTSTAGLHDEDHLLLGSSRLEDDSVADLQLKRHASSEVGSEEFEEPEAKIPEPAWPPCTKCSTSRTTLSPLDPPGVSCRAWSDQGLGTECQQCVDVSALAQANTALAVLVPASGTEGK